MSAPSPFVSVIVPVWNGASDIGRCLDALLAQDYPRDRYEVIVVDNGSEDATRDIVGGYEGVMLLVEPAPGSYKARNLGLANARGEYIAFTDADCTPLSRWLSSAVAAAAKTPNAGVIGGSIALYDAGDSDPVCRAYENAFSFNQALYLSKGHCATANWMSPSSLIREMGGFNDQLRSGGDFELSKRIGSAGHAMVFVPEMTVQHPFRGGFAELAGKRRRTTGGQWVMLRGMRQRMRYVIGVPWTLFKDIAALGRRSEMPASLKLRIAFVMAGLSAAQWSEIVRLWMGGAPRRA